MELNRYCVLEHFCSMHVVYFLYLSSENKYTFMNFSLFVIYVPGLSEADEEEANYAIRKYPTNFSKSRRTNWNSQ